MKIGIVGAGQIGGTLTRRLTALGHKIFVANSRGAETLSNLAAETGATAVSVPEAVRDVDLIVVTIPQKNILNLSAGLFEIRRSGWSSLIPATITHATRRPHRGDRGAGMPESRWVEQQLGRPVIKAFNNIYARHPLERGKPAGVPGRIALPVAGDDDAAKTVVLKLVEELGFDGVDAGGLDEAPGGSSRARRSTPRTSTPTVCGAVCTKRAKTARSNGGAPNSPGTFTAPA